MTENRVTTDSATAKDASTKGLGASADGGLSDSYNAMMAEFYKAHPNSAAGSAADGAAVSPAKRPDFTAVTIGKVAENPADTRDARDTYIRPSDQPSGEQLRLAYLQRTLSNFLPVVLAPEPAHGESKSAMQTPIVDAAAIAAKQHAIALEFQKGEFGPATKEAYGKYVDWLERKALPESRRDLKYVGLGENDEGAADGKHPLAPPADLKIDRNHPPDADAAKRLDNAIKWAQRSDERVEAAKTEILKKVDGSYIESINKLGLPQGWLADIDRDHGRWRNTVGGLIDNALTLRSNIEVIDELNKAGGKLPLEQILGTNNQVSRDKDAKITGIHLDLPRSWDMQQGDNKKRADDLQQLMKDTQALLTPTLPQLRTIGEHPERSVNWGDTEVRDMKGRFDATGNFLGLLGKDDKTKPGERAEDLNLIESRYTTEEKDGKIILHQKVQAQSVPWWGYQNLIGVQNIGKPVHITRSFNPGDSVVVRTDSGFEVKRAEDLGSYRNWQMGKYYGGKVLMGALDAGMLVSGTVELGAAYRAARVAGVGMSSMEFLTRGGVKAMTAEGLEVSGRALVGQAGKGLMRSTVGLTGLLNNAGARETSVGQNINTARSVYFLGDAAVGLGGTGLRYGRTLLGRTEGAASQSLLGRSALPGLVPGSSADIFYKFNHNMFRASEVAFVPMVGSEFLNSAARLRDNTNRHVVRAAEIVAHDDRAANPEKAE